MQSDRSLQWKYTPIGQAAASKRHAVSSKAWLFWAGASLFLLPGLLHAYLLMPFPGSQDIEAITFCYYLEKVIFPLRIAGAILLLVYAFNYFSLLSNRNRLLKAGVLLLCMVSYYVTDVYFKAEKMFEEPQTIQFTNLLHNKVPLGNLVIGVVHNGVAKAYPVIYLGYHHKIQDDIGNLPVMITYCTMCRTGRVYSPLINGKRENFRLVGARHYNAIIEDGTTGTWWYQATGIAAVGTLKGKRLQELPYQQATLENWLARYPASMILQPDQHYTGGYNELENYDRLQAVDRDSMLINKDALVRKSWVLGVQIHNKAKAYDWRQLARTHLLNDEFNNAALLLGIEKDSLSYHVWNRMIDGKSLHFKLSGNNQLSDTETASTWNWDGLCIAGPNKGKRLDKIQAYQEYWHSWKHFHPETAGMVN